MKRNVMTQIYYNNYPKKNSKKFEVQIGIVDVIMKKNRFCLLMVMLTKTLIYICTHVGNNCKT